MSDDPWDPDNESGLAFSGEHADGTVTVTVPSASRYQMTSPCEPVTSSTSRESKGDWGSEVAAMNEVAEVLKRTDLSESLIEPVWVQLRAGASGTGLRGDSFNP